MKLSDTLLKLISRGREGKNIGIPTGSPKMDGYTGGLREKIYTLIFAKSGVGKSSYVLYHHIYRPLKDFPDKNFEVVYYSLELSAEVLMTKLLSLYIWEEYGEIIPYKHLLSWEYPLSDEHYALVVKAKPWIEYVQSRLIIFDKSLSAKSFYASMMKLLEDRGEFVTIDDGKRTIYTKNKEDSLLLTVIDHMGLVRPSDSRTKKQEMDELSSYAVTFREKCRVSFSIVMQENRNSDDFQRNKDGMGMPNESDIKDSGNMYNDSDVCIALYSPVKQQVKTFKGYKIIIENAQDGSFAGLRDRARFGILLKNRYGEGDKMIPMNFFGEIGLFKELPKANTITDYSSYMFLHKEDAENNSEVNSQPQNEHIEFHF